MRLQFLLLMILGFTILGCQHANDQHLSDELELHCTPSKEFITTISYLRQAKAFKLTEDQMKAVSISVAKGCVDAAERFINTVELLVAAGLPTKNSIKLATEMSLSTNEQSDAFKKVFKSSFQKLGLDLNLPESVDVAQQIAALVNGKSTNAADDFDSLVSFCVSKSQLNLPRTYCYQLAMRLSLSNEDRNGSISEPFIDHVQFLTTDDEGPKLTIKDALKISSDLVAISPSATNSFAEAYRFAAAKTGLGLIRSDAVNFAKQLARYTRQLKPDTGGEGRSKLSMVTEP